MRSAAISAAGGGTLTAKNTGMLNPTAHAAAASMASRTYRPPALGMCSRPAVPCAPPKNEADQDDDQQHDAAEVAHAPAEGTDLADGLRRRDQRQQRVVEHRRQLVEDRPDRDADQAEPQVSRLVPDEHHAEQAGHDDTGVDPQPQLAAAGGVAALARHRGHDRDDHARDRGEHAEQLGFVRGIAERLARQVRVEDEGRRHGVEGRERPVPQAPGRTAPRVALARGVATAPGAGGTWPVTPDKLAGLRLGPVKGRPGHAGPAPR